MKTELIANLQPVLETFVDNVLKEAGDVTKLYKSLKLKETQADLLVRDREAELQQAKDFSASEKKKIDILKSEFENRKAQLNNEIQKYELLQAQLIDQNNEAVQSKENLQSKLSVAEDDAFKAKNLRVENEASKLKYEKLLKLIDKDVAWVEEEKKKLGEDKRKLASEQSDLETREAQSVQESHRLNDLDLEIKAREVEAQRIKKRYELKKQIGDKDDGK